MRPKDNIQTVPKDPNGPGLQVIAAGQWRCATSSLQVAFEQILEPPIVPSVHGAYLMPNIKLLKLVGKAMDEQDSSRRRRILHTIFDGYNASSDFPGFAFLDDLLQMYPYCKIILNKRTSALAWETSVRSSLHFFSTRTYHNLTYWVEQSYFHHQMYRVYMRMAQRRFGVDDIFTAECYDRHNEWVREVAAAKGNEVLEWEPNDG